MRETQYFSLTPSAFKEFPPEVREEFKKEIEKELEDQIEMVCFKMGNTDGGGLFIKSIDYTSIENYEIYKNSGGIWPYYKITEFLTE
jgi:hypothetical protein